MDTADDTAALVALRDPKLHMPDGTRATPSFRFNQGLESREPAAKAKAIRLSLALPEDETKQRNTVATMLAALGADREALKIASESP